MRTCLKTHCIGTLSKIVICMEITRAWGVPLSYIYIYTKMIVIIIIKGSWEAIFRVTDDFYLMKGGVRLYIWWLLPDEGWRETLHLITCTWWRVVWDFTSHDFYLMKGGVRLYIWQLLPDEGRCETLHLMTFTWWRVVWDFTSCKDLGKQWPREVVTKGSGDLGIWLHDCCHVLLPCLLRHRVRHVMLQNALWWLHSCCMGCVCGRKPGHETVCFSV